MRITLKGERLGSADRPTTVSVGGRPCVDVIYHAPPENRAGTWTKRANSDEISCALPAGDASVDGAGVDVVVARADVPELRDVVRYLAYQGPPPRMAMPRAWNVAARAVDFREGKGQGPCPST